MEDKHFHSSDRSEIVLSISTSPHEPYRTTNADLAARAGKGHEIARKLSDEMQKLQDSNPIEHSCGDAVQLLSNKISDELSNGRLALDDVEAAVRDLRDANLCDRAARLRSYVGLNEDLTPADRMDAAAATLVEAYDNPVALADALARPSFAAVFTAHPTFALADKVYRHIVDMATDPEHKLPEFKTHRREAPPTLAHEQSLALAAILRGRDALDLLNAAILRHAARKWPDTIFSPRPLILSTWVGFDTDGRNDIHWWDTLRIRLALKRTQLERLHRQLQPLVASQSPLLSRIDEALTAVAEQEAACPNHQHHDASAISAFAKALVTRREAALPNTDVLLPLFEQALSEADSATRSELITTRAGFFAHGLSAAHIHTRLNAAQIYNVARHRLGIEVDPNVPSRRRTVLTQINEALDELQTPLPVDFGALMIEQSSAARLMMTMAQILKHIDSETPIRFLIAETESGYTLLATLWLARLLGIQDRQIQISPLFETQDALEHGEIILEEAFRSPHWRSYLRANGKLCLQFGYSDSGRYIGQLAATNLVERLRLRTLALMQKHGLQDLELVLFDTHGESIGRGAHPFRLTDRLSYFSPEHTHALFAKAGIHIREETAFQGADGYMLFGTPPIAEATVAILAEHISQRHNEAHPDPIYDEPDFSADFFSTIALDTSALVEDPGYAALLGAFGPALIDKSGSRPSARQADGLSVTRITHPSQLRAIPNNAILQQLGWWANVLQGLGTAASRHPDTFEQLSKSSRRFGLALDFARQALAHSDINVLRSTIRMLDPGTWLDRAASTRDEEKRRQYLGLARGLEDQEFWKSLPAMFRRIQADHIALRAVWNHTLRMGGTERTLHAIRHAVIEQIWLLATRIPYFSPRNDISRETLLALILRLDIPVALKHLAQIFPRSADVVADIDFYEPVGPRDDHGFTREHEDIFVPMQRLFALQREISVAILHANGTFG